ncbi:MAG: DinB family protein [Gemmatimonadaceae bacterium]|jgi:uncharacterized damage-inducible protein DinB|nr:DinB family protein [Gemmatimonadaceae bacterium]
MTASVALPPGLPARELAARIDSGLRALDARILTAWERLTPAQRSQPRADGGWSAEQLLEHLTIANSAYLATMRRGVPATLAPSEAPWTPSVAGRLLAWSLRGSFKLPAPGPARPGPQARPAVLEALTGTHAEVRNLLARTRHADWSAVRLVSPLSSLVHMNLGDVFVVLLVHGERHTGQLERLVDQITGGPARA